MFNSTKPLHEINLNLLVCLHALYEERNVTRAAHRLNMTQSNVSKSLSQLRRLMHDHLLYREDNTLKLTPLSHSIRDKVAFIVQNAQEVFSSGVPGNNLCKRRFTLAASDVSVTFGFPQLMKAFLKDAPQAIISLTPWQEYNPESLVQGKADVALCVFEDEHSGLILDKIGTTELACVVNSQHPILQKSPSITLEDYLDYKHIANTGNANYWRVIDKALAEQGYQRDIALEIPLVTAVLGLVESSDLILTLPTPLCHLLLLQNPKLQMFSCPVPASLDYGLMWHSRLDEDTDHIWFRKLVKQTTIECVDHIMSTAKSKVA
ncbi:LysR family transcriptional regulator [Zooshikella ganghwensis]|uniref:LysR family transcriptional regulator n=1 Tax=Zooshikella ganghwensis TaxID=202772 RepID=UPI00040A8F39|nr:LysR family transcriptional regulator [Zooshikella ganghwensis]